MNKKSLLLAAGICALATSAEAQIGPAPVAWYKFDEAAGASTAVNSVAGSTNGIISSVGPGSSVTTGVTGISGNAYQFTEGTTGGGVVDMGNANFFSSITTSGQVTITTWIKTNIQAGTRNVAVFAGNDAVSDRYMDIGYSGAGDPAALPTALTAGRAYGRDRPAGNGINAVGNSVVGRVDDDLWHQLVMTINLNAGSNQLSLYVDGALTNSQTLSGTSLAFPVLNNFEVGRLGRSVPTDYYGGLIDDVQVYNVALTETQVSWLYSNPGLALSAIPEPSAYAWAMAGICGAFVFFRRRSRAS